MIYVFDATRSESLHALLERADGLETVARRVRVRILVATKMDLTSRVMCDPLTLLRARERLGCDGYFETSASTSQSVAQVFDEIIDALTERRQVTPASIRYLSLPPAIDDVTMDRQKFDWRIFLSRLSCGCIDGRRSPYRSVGGGG
jgi:hypothetical protein